MAWVATAVVSSAVIGAVASNSASRRAADAQRGASDAAALQGQIAAEQWDKYQEIYDPLERSMVKEAQEYDSPANYERAAGDASATVASQFGKARDRLTRTPGLDPSSPAAASGMVGLDLAQAASDATQQNAARMQVKNTAYARKTDALSLGKNLPANASTGLANSANTMGNIAASQYGLASNQAAAAGRVTDRLFNSSSNWLGNAQARFSQTELGGSGFGTGLAYGNEDFARNI